ncbi:M23 family metallopeptidase [Microvirga pudoricolor]|uniref:M23 family metallopeptidase n=1 Tax=Microvirga pudoricolor TaxID=2778729 RepID=UPI001951100C|nr:M23 family metallopeptidase [Microvirga pudoricolor]MBM6595506.1 M23 family metallopeptidase [Microvirga pudoricolor]
MSQHSPHDAPLRKRKSGAGASGIDIGQEPPLNTEDGSERHLDRRDINLRWLGASVLTGVTGAALIGASIHVALQGAMTAITPPEKAVVAAIRADAASDQPTNAARKGDRLIRSDTSTAARQTFRAPMTIRSGEREAIKVRHFVRVATNLALSSGTYATDIPSFNPMRLFAEDAGERYVEPAPVEIADADVAVVRTDLSMVAVEATAPSLNDDDVISILEEERRVSNDSRRQTAVPIPAQQMLSRTLRSPDGLGDALGYARIIDAPFSSIEVRVVPENVTDLPKTDQKAASPIVEERDLVLKKGETLETNLRSYGANPEQIRAITTALGATVKVASLPEGERIRILIAPGPRLGDARQIVRVTLIGERGVEAIAATNDRGVFVSVTPPVDESNQGAVASQEEEPEEDDGRGVRLYDSLYETALKNDLPRSTVEELVRIFGFDVDFQRRVSSGDTFEVFYGSDDEDGPPEILYAALTIGGEARRVFRYQGDDGAIDFFDDQGRSLKKFLLRKPIAEGILRSGFGSRYHPILGYTRPHTGIDWANRIGTPILSAGNGTVIKAGWESGYGRRVEVQHANGYVTTYNHMSNFGKGISAGARVQQGQVVGYLGSTGLSTGPHLHYEVMINGHFVDPMKIRLPRGRELEGRGLAEFKRQREQIQGLVAQADSPTGIAQRAELR